MSPPVTDCKITALPLRKKILPEYQFNDQIQYTIDHEYYNPGPYKMGVFSRQVRRRPLGRFKLYY